jgi:PAP2 superfamily
MRHLFSGLLTIAISFIFTTCKAPETYSTDYAAKANNPEFVHAGIRRTIDIIRYDIFAPPIASRILAYASIAGYEATLPGFPEYQSLAGQLNGLNPTPQPEANKAYCFPLAGANAMLIVSKTLVFSEGDVDSLKEQVLDNFKAMNMPPDVFERSMKYGEAVAKHILAWSKQDNYAQLRSAPKFTIDTKDAARWRPTPPMYADALEPHWNKIRPWVLDSASQFKAAAPVPFSTQKNSAFYKQAYEVYQIRKSLSEADSLTAWYWDDNPFALQVSGHFSYGVKKISPGGHWMLITSTACRNQNADMMRSLETYVRVICAIADGFIQCWDTKYRSNLIRPESYINEYIDPKWAPMIQTPPFPEHTSGHSTISAAAAAVLTRTFGDQVAFTDSTEVEFGMEPRTFKSFNEAADQVGLSRLYGGIHYRHGNVEGLKCGRQLGEWVFQQLKTRK